MFKCKKITNFALSLENKSAITVREFIFHYAINSCLYLKRQRRAVTKSFLGTAPAKGFGGSILSRKYLMHFLNQITQVAVFIQNTW